MRVWCWCVRVCRGARKGRRASGPATDALPALPRASAAPPCPACSLGAWAAATRAAAAAAACRQDGGAGRGAEGEHLWGGRAGGGGQPVHRRTGPGAGKPCLGGREGQGGAWGWGWGWGAGRARAGACAGHACHQRPTFGARTRCQHKEPARRAVLSSQPRAWRARLTCRLALPCPAPHRSCAMDAASRLCA